MKRAGDIKRGTCKCEASLRQAESQNSTFSVATCNLLDVCSCKQISMGAGFGRVCNPTAHKLSGRKLHVFKEDYVRHKKHTSEPFPVHILQQFHKGSCQLKVKERPHLA